MGGVRRHLGDGRRRLAEHRGSRVEEGHLRADHVHMLVSIPPKYSVAQVIGYIKGKSAIHSGREFAGGRAATVRSTLGLGATSCPRWVETSERFARISERRNRKSDSSWVRADTRRVAQVTAPRSRPAALSGSQVKAPGFGGGYLLPSRHCSNTDPGMAGMGRVGLTTRPTC